MSLWQCSEHVPAGPCCHFPFQVRSFGTPPLPGTWGGDCRVSTVGECGPWGGKLVPQFLPFCTCSLSSRDGKPQAPVLCHIPHQKPPPAPACCGTQRCPTRALALELGTLIGLSLSGDVIAAGATELVTNHLSPSTSYCLS